MRSFLHRVTGALALAAVALIPAPASAEDFDFGSLIQGDGAPLTASFASLSTTVVGNDVLFTLDAYGLDQFSGNEPWIGAMSVDGMKTGAISDVNGDANVTMGKGDGPDGRCFATARAALALATQLEPGHAAATEPRPHGGQVALDAQPCSPLDRRPHRTVAHPPDYGPEAAG